MQSFAREGVSVCWSVGAAVPKAAVSASRHSCVQPGACQRSARMHICESVRVTVTVCATLCACVHAKYAHACMCMIVGMMGGC